MLAPLLGCVGAIGSPDGSEDDSDGNGPGGHASSMCVVDTPLRRMTRFEYNNTVRDLLGDTTNPADSLPPEEEVAGFNNQAAALTVSDLLAEQYMKLSEAVSVRALADLDKVTGGCGDATCVRDFIADFGARAFRRPLTEEDIDRLEALYQVALADADMGTHADGVELVLQAILQSPHFLYRPEFGGADPVDGDVVALNSWEMASKLSYMLWNTMPDQALFDAAEAGELSTNEQIADQARRMLGDARAVDAVTNFHRQWLHLTHLDTLSKNTDVYPLYSDGLRSLWREEVERFIAHVVLEGDGSMKTLLTAPYSFMNAELATLYGDDVVGDLPAGEEFQQVDLDPARRGGLLTQGALMAALAKGDQSSPVYRGKFVREQLLCQSLPLPPANLVIVPPELDSTKTTREQFEEIGSNPDCASCHSLMNPVGFAFENYDAIGLWRDTQNGKPIDATGDIIQTDDLDGKVDGAVELGKRLAESEQVATCIASQWFRFSYNRTVTEDDACNMEQINEAFVGSDFDIRELLVALTQTETFRYRHRVVAEGGDL